MTALLKLKISIPRSPFAFEVGTISDPVMGVPLCAVETLPLPVLSVGRLR